MMPENGKGQALTAQQMAQALREEDDFVLIAHVSPDGDTIGSSLALLQALHAEGKRAVAVMDGKIPVYLHDLSGMDQLQHYDEAMRPRRNAIAVDCADRARLGKAIALFDGAQQRWVIDHHTSNNGFAEQNLIDGDKAATAELILDIIDQWEIPLDPTLAQSLYLAITSDTGGFAYSNTSENTLRAAARLVSTGIDFPAIYRRLFRMRSVVKTRLLGYVLSHFSLRLGGKMAVAVVDWNALSSIGATDSDSEGVVEALRDINGVEMAVFIRQFNTGTYKVSMRSVNAVDVAALASERGGGGHVRAAGFDWQGSVDEIIDWLEGRAAESLR